MSLLERLQADMVAAMKAKDESRLGTVRMMKTALKKLEVDSMKPLTEATEQQVLSTLIKQRHESVEMFRKGGREDLAANEEKELAIIETYMPKMAGEDDVRAAVEAALQSLVQKNQQTFAAQPAAAAEAAGTPAPVGVPLANAAALANVARMILNLDEVISKE